MSAQSWLMYLMLVFIATSSPGPAVLFVVTNSTMYGRRKAVYAALGNIIGLFCLGLMAIAGLGTILKTSEFFFNLVKYIGAAYLVYLGIRLILQKSPDVNQLGTQFVRKKNISNPKVFFQALTIALSNPKAIVFLTALFPQFIDVERAVAPQFAGLIAILMFFSFSFLMFYSLLAHRVKRWLTRGYRVTLFNRISGAIFIFFGFLLTVSSNK